MRNVPPAIAAISLVRPSSDGRSFGPIQVRCNVMAPLQTMARYWQ
jgi:hypothetical protein